ncbi:MAG: hypothetical protein QM728_07235 [Gordonia sp. (in: high G+C Gram-positive bacteria)]|uniref:PH-like domain-containing protein n=1 Tax=Gordonia sp. (in: high G+C Gram-positive bacteria) TaxID=84139 RepID=UPI0039E671EE
MSAGEIVFNIVFLAGVAAFLVFIGWLLWLVFTGRGRKGRAQYEQLGGLPAAPDNPGEVVVGPTGGLYLGTTRADNWIDRIHIDGLGDRAQATATGYTHGVAIARKGATDLWIPAESLTGVRASDRAAGKVVHAGGVLALDWTMPGGTALTTALRADDKGDYPHWLVAYPGAAQPTDPDAAE